MSLGDDDRTPPRRPSSIRLMQWGIVQAWLSEREGRGLTLLVDGQFVLVAIDPEYGERREIIGEHDEPSQVALRAIGKMRN